MLNIDFPPQYPKIPPKIMVTTPIFHPNLIVGHHIDKKHIPVLQSWGDGLDRTKCNMPSIMEQIVDLLRTPLKDDPLMGSHGSQIASSIAKFNPKQFEQLAREWTITHAFGAKR